MSHLIKFDGEIIITPIQWDESYSVVEAEMQTEAGTTISNVVRRNVLSVAAQWQVSSFWYEKLMAYASKGTVVLNCYDPVTGQAKNHNVRFRDVSASFQRFSERNPGTEGYWVFSCNIKEY